MKHLLVLLLSLFFSAVVFASPHVISDDYSLTGDQPASFVIQCGSSATFASTPSTDTAGTNGTVPVKNGLYLYADLAAVPGYAPGASCTVYAADAVGIVSTKVAFTIPAGPSAPVNVKIVL